MNPQRPVAVLGAGGHAKVVVAALRAQGRAITGCYIRRGDPRGPAVLGVAVRFEDEIAPGTELMLATGENALRERLATTFSGPWATVIHPSAFVDPTASLGPGTVICAGAVVQADACVGAHAIVNTHASVDHDCVIGAFVHIAPGAHLAGDVIVEDSAFIGTGASIIPGLRIGRGATVGAGAAVIRGVAAGTTVVGVPARPRAGRG